MAVGTIPGVYRVSGILVLFAGLVLTYSLVLTTFSRPVERWTFNEAGGLTQQSTECPSPVSLLFGDGQNQMEQPADAQLCVLSARTLFIEGVIVLGLSVGLGVWGMTRGKRPEPQQIRALPSAQPDEEGS